MIERTLAIVGAVVCFFLLLGCIGGWALIIILVSVRNESPRPEPVGVPVYIPAPLEELPEHEGRTLTREEGDEHEMKGRSK